MTLKLILFVALCYFVINSIARLKYQPFNLLKMQIITVHEALKELIAHV